MRKPNLQDANTYNNSSIITEDINPYQLWAHFLSYTSIANKVVGNVQSWSWNNSGTGRQCGFPLKWPTKKKIPKKFNLQGYRPRKLGLGGPIGLGPTQDPFWGLKLKIYYKKHIFGAFFVFMENKFVIHFLDLVL